MNRPDKARRASLSRHRFERLVRKVLAMLPEEFQAKLENVVVVIEEEPPEDMPDVMGLYEGISLIDRSSEDIELSDLITIFKGPIERSCHTEQEIESEVRLTVLHEFGHYFGLDEAQLK
ncbi:MAG: metallopeptidase family protein [Chloroflexota bacterium]